MARICATPGCTALVAGGRCTDHATVARLDGGRSELLDLLTTTRRDSP